jgi:hypothetical protein
LSHFGTFFGSAPGLTQGLFFIARGCQNEEVIWELVKMGATGNSSNESEKLTGHQTLGYPDLFSPERYKVMAGEEKNAFYC